jgi:hypothetical protein
MRILFFEILSFFYFNKGRNFFIMNERLYKMIFFKYFKTLLFYLFEHK